MARYQNPTYNSGNPWSRGFQNLGTAIYGDPAAAEDAALAASREASTIKTYEEINRGLRADQELTQLGTLAQNLFKTPDGQPLTPEQISAAYTQLLPHLIGSGYNTDQFGNILTQGGALGGDEEVGRRTFIAGGGQPTLDFAVTPQAAEAIRRSEPIVAGKDQRVVIPPPIYPQNSMADTVAPLPQSGATVGVQPQGTSAPAAVPATRGEADYRAAFSKAPPEIVQAITAAAQKNGVPPELLMAIAYRESGFDPQAVGDKYLETGPSRGMFQFQGGTAQDMGLADPFDVAASSDAAARYLKGLYDQFGSWDQAVVAYNWGQGNLRKSGMNAMPASTRGYLAEVSPFIPASMADTVAPVSVAPVASDVAATQQGGVIEGMKSPISASPGETILDGNGNVLFTAPPEQKLTTVDAGKTVIDQNGKVVFKAPEGSEFITTEPGKIVLKVSGDQVTTIKEAVPEAETEDVAPGHTIIVKQPDGSYKEVFQADYSPEQADGEDGGAGGKPVKQPTLKEWESVQLDMARGLGIPPDKLEPLYAQMTDEENIEFQNVTQKAWNDSNGNMGVAAAAGRKWIDDHFDITFTPGSDSWLPFDETAEAFSIVRDPNAPPPVGTAAPPAATTPAATPAPTETTQPPPAPANAADRVVGQVYMTAKFGPMKWAGDGWEEP